MEWTGSLHSSDKFTSTYKVPTGQHLVEGDVGNSEMSLTRALTPRTHGHWREGAFSNTSSHLRIAYLCIDVW